MRLQLSDKAQAYLKISFCFLLTILLVRVFEYIAVASKVFVANPLKYEMLGLLYDGWFWLIYSFIGFLLFLLFSAVSKKTGIIASHIFNVIILSVYLGLIITFSERNTPFDHEIFTRKLVDSFTTMKQMTTTGFSVFVPFAIYIPLYFLFNALFFRKRTFEKKFVVVMGMLAVIATGTISFANPKGDWFNETSAYYLTSNKLSYWFKDSYNYFTNLRNTSALSTPALAKEIDFYQQHQPFTFSSKEYALLHLNNEGDVLGGFFNLKSTPPNIVIVVWEGLSRDFSGDKAYAGSFTPFLDSLSHKSLEWDNFLSTAPGTFAAHPAISGSLPYAKRGFSIMNVMPDHLSLIKILKHNGYYTNFMIGFNPDFDNMGGYIRLQGTDFILTDYGSKYKEMGVGEEGWSMGYPDDALYQRSFEVLDSIHKAPYLSIYHTATSHMPYLFEQKPTYEKLFDEKLKTMRVKPAMKKTLIETKKVITTFMFADDCLKKFFADYEKRPDFQNTIFIITGDHHIGSFPSTGPIDDYHVPFVVYSPMLKRSGKFLSLNSHNNIAPTITNLLLKNYKFSYKPKEVHWLGSVMDTSASFRNIHAMPFMSWSREINDYLYKDYFLSDDRLYKFTPDLLLQPVANDSMKNFITRLRENFKVINNYVCDNNKVYPVKDQQLPGEKVLLKEFKNKGIQKIFSNLSDTSLTADFVVPKNYKYLYVEATGSVMLPGKETDYHPTIRFALIDTKNNGRNYLYYSKRDIATLSKGEFVMNAANQISVNDLFSLDDFKEVKGLVFETAIYTDSIPINLQLKNFDVKIYGVEKGK